MCFANEKVEGDGFNHIGRRGQPDIFEGAATERFGAKGKLVIDARSCDAAGKRIEAGVPHRVENLRA